MSEYYTSYMLASAVVFLATFLVSFLFADDLHIIIIYLIAINATTLLMYFWDKSSILFFAQRYRVPEKILHGLAFLGGSPMALMAQFILRHKTRKFSFQIMYTMIVLVQIVLIAGFMFYRFQLQ